MEISKRDCITAAHVLTMMGTTILSYHFKEKQILTQTQNGGT